MYAAEIIFSVKEELTAREKLKLTDLKGAIPLDNMVKGHDNHYEIEVDYYVMVHVVNDKADNREYDKLVIVSPDGVLYTTGSQTFIDQFKLMDKVLRSEGEVPYTIVCYGMPSRNYPGREFLTCSIV